MVTDVDRQERAVPSEQPVLPVDLNGRARAGGICILVVGAYLLLIGLMGPHGEGGGGIGYHLLTTWLGLLSVPSGLLTSVAGVSCQPGSTGRRLVRVHLAICGIALALLWFVPAWNWN